MMQNIVEMDLKSIYKMSNDDLKKLALEVKKFNKAAKPLSLRRSSMLKKLMETSIYEYYIDKLDDVTNVLRREIFERFIDGKIK